MKAIIIYFIGINIFSFITMGADKSRARRHAWRISEATLFLAACLGGGIGATAGMYVFHHKTRHWYFVVGMPLIALINVVLAALLIGAVMLLEDC